MKNMKVKNNWQVKFSALLKEFIHEVAKKPQYEIVNIYECNKTGFTKAVIKLSERHTIEKTISEIIVDNDLIENLDNKVVRTLTYMATVEHLKPDYSIVVQHMTSEVDEYLLEIKSKNNHCTLIKSPSDLSKDKELLAKFNSIDANRIGYMAGVRETVKEFRSLSNKDL